MTTKLSAMRGKVITIFVLLVIAAVTVGLPPDMNFLGRVSGSESVLALYDIGKLQFLYITRLPSAASMQNQLWQTRSKFETRSAGGTTFYLRRATDSEREVAFAVRGD